MSSNRRNSTEISSRKVKAKIELVRIKLVLTNKCIDLSTHEKKSSRVLY